MPQLFEYHQPRNRAEALELLARPDYHALPLITHPKPDDPRKMGADAFIDLSLLGMDYIQETKDGSVHIGSLATLQGMVESPILNAGQHLLLSQAAGMVAGLAIRNLSGLWGVIQARSGPPQVLLALLVLEAQVIILGKGEKQRTLSLPEYQALGSNSLQKGELVLEAILPPQQTGGWALEQVARTPRDEAIVAGAAVLEVENEKIRKLYLALFGASPLPMRQPGVEDLLTGKAFDAQNLAAAVETVMTQADPPGDFRGSPEYRRSMAGLVTRRVLEKAWNRAIGQGVELPA